MLLKFGVRSNMIRLIKSNFSIYRVILVLLMTLYENGNTPGSTYANVEHGIYQIIAKNIIIFFVVPAIVSLIIMFLTYLKDKIECKKLTQGYYRDIIKQISPVELSYIDNYDIEWNKDITATLLELQLKKKIEFKDDEIIIIDKEEDNMTIHEKYILNGLVNKSFFRNQKVFIDGFRKSIFDDLEDSKLLEKDKLKSMLNFENKYKKIKYIALIIFTIILIIFSFFDEDLMLPVMWMFMLLIFFGSFFFNLFSSISSVNKKKVSASAKTEAKKVGCLASIMGGVLIYICFSIFVYLSFSFAIWTNYPEKVATFLQYCFLIIGIVSMLIEFYLIINNNKLSKKGKKIKSQLLGMKLFLKDYGDMKSKELNEINLWDEYIIYAIILSENKKITRKIMKMINNKFKYSGMNEIFDK